MKIDYNHPEFGVWHLAEPPLKHIPYGALIKWFDRVIQFGFHLGGEKIAWRDGVLSAENLDTDPGLPWKRRSCVLAREGQVIVFRQETLRAREQAGLHATRQEFISACLGDDLGTWGNFPVRIFERCGKCFLYPIAQEAIYEEPPCGKTGEKNPPCHKMAEAVEYVTTENKNTARATKTPPDGE